MYEILTMINKRSSDRVQEFKMSLMLESSPPEVKDNFPSPRVLNTHFRPRLQATTLFLLITINNSAIYTVYNVSFIVQINKKVIEERPTKNKK